MKYKVFMAIAEKITEASKADGVRVVVNSNPMPIRGQSCNIEAWDVELIYRNYHLIERFNSEQSITCTDVNKIATYVLGEFFFDYFRAKIKALKDGIK